MFDYVLDTPRYTITIFFSWRFHFKVNDFLTFSVINFSYQYLQEAKAYLEPSWTSAMELFHENFFLPNSQEDTCAGVSFY